MPIGTTTYATVLPDGSILFDFPGHVQAVGIDLIAGDSGSNPADRKIRWHKDTFTGAVVADVYAGYTPVSQSAYAHLDAVGPDGTGGADMSLTGVQATGIGTSEIFATVFKGVASQAVRVIDSAGNSDFVQRNKLDAARAYRNAAQNIANTGWTKILLDTASYNLNGTFDIANSRYICPRQGFYQVNGNLSLSVQNATNFHAVSVFKNGGANPYSQGGMLQNGGAIVGWAQGYQVSDIIQCNAGDVLELYGFNSGAAATTPILNGFAWLNYLSVSLVSY